MGESSSPGHAESPDSVGTGPAGHASDEYGALRDTVGVVDRSDIAQIRMFGRDPIRMLNGLITNDLADLSPAKAVYGAMLTPKGRMLADVRVVLTGAADSPELLLDVPRVALENVLAHFRKYLPPSFARFEATDARLIGVYGPAAGVVVSEIGGAIPDAIEDAAVPAFFVDPVPVVATDVIGQGAGFDLHVGVAGAERLERALIEAAAKHGGRAAGFGAFEVMRVEAGRPRFGPDMDEETIPAEAYGTTGLMSRAVSFSKGCYTGQEVVVRIAHRGHVNRHLRGLVLGQVPPPETRTDVRDPESGKVVGWTTSAVVSPRVGRTISLAYLRREVEVGATVAVGPDGERAAVVGLPFD